LDYAIGGWRLTLINTMSSGLPVNLTYSPTAAFQVSTAPTYRPNLTGQELIGDPKNPTAYLSLTGATIPTDRSQPFGNAPRNPVRGPNFFQADLGLHKSFPVWRESTKLEFRMEAFNLFNRTNFTTPNGNVSNIRRDAQGNAIAGGTYGTITSTFPAREIQFALKLYF
jgi:hypothetical protein